MHVVIQTLLEYATAQIINLTQRYLFQRPAKLGIADSRFARFL